MLNIIDPETGKTVIKVGEDGTIEIIGNKDAPVMTTVKEALEWLRKKNQTETIHKN